MIERIFIDATYTLASGKNSGIERVVRSILRESTLMGRAGVIPMPQLVISLSGRFFAVDEADVADFRRPAAMHANVLSMLPSSYRMLANALCGATGSDRLRKWTLPQAGHLGMFKLPHTWFENVVRRRIASRSKAVEFRRSDLLLLPDAYWVNRLRSSVWPAAGEARLQGSLVATLLYDLIPLTHPEFVGLKRRDAFLDYLKKAASHSDLLLAISGTVRDQVASYLQTLSQPGDKFCTDIRSFQLGSELENVTGRVREEVRELFGGPTPPYLMVATFDPRKNHKYLLDAFQRLWQRRPDLKLCLVGRIGSRCDDIVQRIASHPNLGERLYLFSDLSDAELQHCYSGARGVIFPSIVEGFGLPIVESLWFGKRTFASDTAIHREVGRSDCSYFSLDDPDSLVDQIVEWESVLGSGQTPTLPVRKPLRWHESATQVINHCMQASQQARMPRFKHAA